MVAQGRARLDRWNLVAPRSLHIRIV